MNLRRKEKGGSRETYRFLCEQESSIPLFSQAWWLDAVAGDQWDVILVKKGGQVFASMPYAIKQRFGFKILGQPEFTQNLGPWLRKTNSKYTKRLAREKDLMNSLIEQLPAHHSFTQNWHHSQTNWLPFYWQNFQQTTQYTYRIESLVDENKIWSGLKQNIRTDIKKAAGREGVRVRTDLNIDDFFELNCQVFERQGIKMPYTLDFVRRLDKAAQERKAKQIFIAEDKQGRRHSGVYIVWDENSAYYLMGGGHPKLRRSGATSLCMWEAIRFAATVSRSFDFEGSMIEPVERFFRAFGAIQTPYFKVFKTTSKLISLKRFVHKFRKI